MRGHDVRLGQRAESGLGARDRHQVLDAQRMAPTPGAELFLAKVIANFLFVTIVQIALAPVFLVLYNLTSRGSAWLLALVLPLGTWALVANGTFFAALAIRSRNRELLLPLILFPIFLPALLAMVVATTVNSYRRKRSVALDQAAGRLRHYLHHREPVAVRCDLSMRSSSFLRWRPSVWPQSYTESSQNRVPA